MSELGWRKTWDDEPDREDYVCIADGQQVARIYPMSATMIAGSWKWFASFAVVPNRGEANSRREAMLAIEERWERFSGAAPAPP